MARAVGAEIGMILHIPHASKVLPAERRGQFILTDEGLGSELHRMTDAYTDELFDMPGASTHSPVFVLSPQR